MALLLGLRFWSPCYGIISFVLPRNLSWIKTSHRTFLPILFNRFGKMKMTKNVVNMKYQATSFSDTSILLLWFGEFLSIDRNCKQSFSTKRTELKSTQSVNITHVLQERWIKLLEGQVASRRLESNYGLHSWHMLEDSFATYHLPND